MDATAELDETINDGEWEWLKCVMCGWRGRLDRPVQQEEPMGKWSEEARLAFHARKAAKQGAGAGPAGASAVRQSVMVRPVKVTAGDALSLTGLDVAIERLHEDVATLIRAREIVERYQ